MGYYCNLPMVALKWMLSFRKTERTQSMSKRIVIVGGVAAGASAAAKARRVSEDVEIVLVEAGKYVSFANCGLPYYVGGEIARREDLFVVTPQMFRSRFDIDVRCETVAAAVEPRRKCVTLVHAGDSRELQYDRLILATGTEAVIPPIPGLDQAGMFTVRTVMDVDAIVARLAEVHPAGDRATAGAEAGAESPARALVIGGGYIGLEMAEQLRRRGLHVTIVEMLPQLLSAMDPEMAVPVQSAMVEAGCEVMLGDAVARITAAEGRNVAVTKSGRRVPFDLGIVSVGVRPNVELAKSAGIKLGATGAIAVDRSQRTSDPSIYAAGDNSETFHAVLGRAVNIPLAGPANKAGRVAGANAALDLCGAPADDPQRLWMPDVLGTAIVRAGGAVAAVTGVTETQARREGIECAVMYLPGRSHAEYYPGAAMVLLKLIYAPATGKLLGAQGVGGPGVDKRIDVIATAIKAGLTVEDLEDLDLCYSPQFGSAKDATILAGFAAANTRREVMPAMTPGEMFDRIEAGQPLTVLDVRTQPEWDAGHVEGAMHVELGRLRKRIAEVPADKPLAVTCGSGYRSYLAQRILINAGRKDVYNVLGGRIVTELVQAARAGGKKKVIGPSS